MKKVTVQVGVDRHEHKGWALEDVEGLAAVNHEGVGWRVVHTRSGLDATRTWRTRKEALDVIEKIGPLADWTRSAAELVGDYAELGEEVAAAVAEVAS